MKNLNKIDPHELKLGMRFSAPLFFDDGESMFLAEERAVKSYHLSAVVRWNVPYLLTYGHPLTGNEKVGALEDLDDVEELDSLEEIDGAGDLEELDELEDA